jgi:hypothetical protein
MSCYSNMIGFSTYEGENSNDYLAGTYNNWNIQQVIAIQVNCVTTSAEL